MNLTSVLVRFAGLYVVLMALLAIGFAAAGFRTHAGMNVAALAGAIVWPCITFRRRNGRYFSADEKKRVVIGMIAIDLAIQLASGLVFFATGMMSVPSLLTGLATVGALHAVAIWLLVTLTGRLVGRSDEPAQAAGTAPIAGPDPASGGGPARP
jgi:hypothetical protein